MATSGSVDFSTTRNKIIRQALLSIQALEENETINPTVLDDAAEMLNMLVKQISTKKPLWKKEDITIPLYDAKQSYTIGQTGNKKVDRPISVSSVRRLSSDGETEVPLEPMSWAEYKELPTKGSTGLISQYHYNPQLTNGVLYVWPVSDDDSTSLSDGSTNQWTVSSTTTEYYYTGSDITAEPEYVFINGVEMTQGTVGSLAANEYGWGDNDSLGTDTLYVYSATDPDATADSVICLADVPDRVVMTCHMPIEDFDSAGNNPDFPQEAYLMLVFGLATLLCPQYNLSRMGAISTLYQNYLNEYLSNDIEIGPLKIQPRFR